MFLHRSLRQKKRARKGKTSGFVPRHPCKQRCHNHCCAPLITLRVSSSLLGIVKFRKLHLPLLSLRSSVSLSLHLVLTVSCQLVFSSKRLLSRHPRLLLHPKPSKVSLRSISLYWVQPPLIVRLACCSRGCRAVTVFALLRFVSFAPALNYRCGSIRFLRDLNPLNSHILSTQKRACLSLITLRSAHSSTFH